LIFEKARIQGEVLAPRTELDTHYNLAADFSPCDDTFISVPAHHLKKGKCTISSRGGPVDDLYLLLYWGGREWL